MNNLRVEGWRSLQVCFGKCSNKSALSSALVWQRTPVLCPKVINSQKAFSSSSSARAPASQNEYLIVIPDFPDTGRQRVKAKPGHIADATPLIDAGIISYFGVTLSSGEISSESIDGSAIVMRAESEIEVREFLQKDEYTVQGVWNVTDAKIWRFRSG